MKKDLLKVTVYKAGYEVREEMWHHDADDEPTRMRSAYSPKGDYIGDPKTAKRLIENYGITHFEAYESDSRVVCHGYSPSKKKWFGWSHRALVGFGIGDLIFEEDYGDDKTLFTKHGNLMIVTLEDAKKAALAFAEYVA